MRIIPLRSMVGSYGSIRKGVGATVPDDIAKKLIKRGIAVPEQGKGEASKADLGPSRKEGGKSPSGFRNGKAKPSSSSQADQASKDSPSSKSEDAAE